MAEFQEDKFELFLGVLRKYMQVRGQLSQKELAELVDVGVSTMSRFLNMKTNDFNPQMVAKIVARLQIPLHEMIDFVDEEFTDKFIRLVKFYRDEMNEKEKLPDYGPPPQRSSDEMEDALEKELVSQGQSSTAQREVVANIKVGNKTTPITYKAAGGGNERKEMNLADKIHNLSPRQKAYLHDFLNLDMEGRDLIVDLGNNLFRYFKQKGMDL